MELKTMNDFKQAILEKLYSGKLEKLILIRDGFELSDQAFGDLIKELIANEQECQDSSESDKVIEEAKEEHHAYPYYIYRKAAGAFLYEKGTDDYAGKLSERALERLGLEDGDEVSASFSPNNTPIIRDILKKNVSREEKRIVEFDYATVEEAAGRLFIKKNINGQRLSDINDTENIFLIPEKYVSDFGLKEGSVVNMAWEISSPSNIKIRKIYDVDEFIEERRKPNKYKKESHAPSSKDKYTPFLTGHMVGIVIGDKLRDNELTELVQQLGGEAVIVDGFKKGNNVDYYQNNLSKLDLVVMVKNYIKHSTTKIVYDICSQNDIPFSYANTAGLESVARAIYRASIGAEVEENNFDGEYSFVTKEREHNNE